MKPFTPSEFPQVFVQLLQQTRTTRLALSNRSGLARRTIDILATGEHSSRVATVQDALQAIGYDLYLVAVEVGAPRPELVKSEQPETKEK